ncbi:MAG: dephospho-CoA kinase [Paludibacteraceae bacterium]|jgi:dephospho-CoA kinase|nr:dephospho-CoA kinase [Paludibacteraceae bacterium]HHT61408.1 dephospho-CoA kinase [Bacteroidales bacterium]MBP9039148.1 dephospho-CoA kinase [Paludibacteraceae bacterium]HOA46237.1 dephospho-CoA kinase [Paludibacteraceae bacterium]HOH70934.1 dephospho-CoA kinase [Paludibacteraceae bacterium]
MLKIGITGGIGSGKSVVANILQQMGFPVYDSDSRAKALTQTNADIRQQLTAMFGDNLFKYNILDKKALSQLIFSSDKNLKAVNAIIHPVVVGDFATWTTRQNAAAVFLESAILMESGLYQKMDKIILVTTPEKLRIDRVMKRSQLSEKEIQQRMQMQKTEETLADKADFVILNDEKHLLIPQVHSILQKLLII